METLCLRRGCCCSPYPRDVADSEEMLEEVEADHSFSHSCLLATCDSGLLHSQFDDDSLLLSFQPTISESDLEHLNGSATLDFSLDLLSGNNADCCPCCGVHSASETHACDWTCPLSEHDASGAQWKDEKDFRCCCVEDHEVSCLPGDMLISTPSFLQDNDQVIDSHDKFHTLQKPVVALQNRSNACTTHNLQIGTFQDDNDGRTDEKENCYFRYGNGKAKEQANFPLQENIPSKSLTSESHMQTTGNRMQGSYSLLENQSDTPPTAELIMQKPGLRMQECFSLIDFCPEIALRKELHKIKPDCKIQGCCSLPENCSEISLTRKLTRKSDMQKQGHRIQENFSLLLNQEGSYLLGADPGMQDSFSSGWNYLKVTQKLGYRMQESLPLRENCSDVSWTRDSEKQKLGQRMQEFFPLFEHCEDIPLTEESHKQEQKDFPLLENCKERSIVQHLQTRNPGCTMQDNFLSQENYAEISLTRSCISKQGVLTANTNEGSSWLCPKADKAKFKPKPRQLLLDKWLFKQR